MKEVIMNEKLWVENMMENNTLGARPGETLMRIAKYYHAQGYKKREIERRLEEYILRCDPSSSIPKWAELIRRCTGAADKYPLIRVESIRITEAEMAIVKQYNSVRLQRLLFTLICLAKYGNAVDSRNDGWVNWSPREIFRLANVIVPVRMQSTMINELWRNGHVRYSTIIDNINLQMICLRDGDDIAIEITDTRNIGNQYMKYIGEKYMECQSCGLVIRQTNNRQRYCPQCAVEINIRTTAEQRNKQPAA